MTMESACLHEPLPLPEHTVRRETPDAIISAMLTLVREKLPNYVHADMFDIQIMTPMRR